MIKLAMLLLLARGYVGAPYQWGGRGEFKWTKQHGLVERPVTEPWRFDCSGFVTTLIHEAGGPDLRDHTASMLWDATKARVSTDASKGTFLVFYGPHSGRYQHVSHVAIVIDGQLFESAAKVGVTTRPYDPKESKLFLGERELP